MLPNDSRFWQHKVYADIRGGSQDLCKFSLDFMPIRPYITNTGTARRSRFQVQVFGLWQLSTNTAVAGSEMSD